MNPTQNMLVATGLPVAEMLRAAADYIDTYGWTRGQLYNLNNTATPPVCALGAIDSVTRWVLGPLPTPTTSTLQAICLEGLAVTALAFHIAPDLDDAEVGSDELRMVIERWNDSPNRTKTDVTTVLRATAANWAGDAR